MIIRTIDAPDGHWEFYPNYQSLRLAEVGDAFVDCGNTFVVLQRYDDSNDALCAITSANITDPFMDDGEFHDRFLKNFTGLYKKRPRELYNDRAKNIRNDYGNHTFISFDDFFEFLPILRKFCGDWIQLYTQISGTMDEFFSANCKEGIISNKNRPECIFIPTVLLDYTIKTENLF